MSSNAAVNSPLVYRTTISKAFIDSIMPFRVTLSYAANSSNIDQVLAKLNESKGSFSNLIKNNYKLILSAKPPQKFTQPLQDLSDSFDSYTISSDNYTQSVDKFFEDAFKLTTFNDEIEVDELLKKISKLEVLLRAYAQTKNSQGADKAKKFEDIYLTATKTKICDRAKILVSEDIKQKLLATNEDLDNSFKRIYLSLKSSFESDDESTTNSIKDQTLKEITETHFLLIKLVVLLNLYIDAGEILTEVDIKTKVFHHIVTKQWPEGGFKAFNYERKLILGLLDDIERDANTKHENSEKLVNIAKESRTLVDQTFPSDSESSGQNSRLNLDKEKAEELKSKANELIDASNEMKVMEKLSQAKSSQSSKSQNTAYTNYLTSHNSEYYRELLENDKDGEIKSKLDRLDQLESEIKDLQEKIDATSDPKEKEILQNKLNNKFNEYSALSNELAILKRQALANKVENGLKQIRSSDQPEQDAENISENLKDLEKNEDLINSLQGNGPIKSKDKTKNLDDLKNYSLEAKKNSDGLNEVKKLPATESRQELMKIQEKEKNEKSEKALDSLNKFTSSASALDQQYVPPKFEEVDEKDKIDEEEEAKKREAKNENATSLSDLKSMDKVDESVQLAELPKGDIADTATGLFDQANKFHDENPIVIQCRLVTVCLAKFQLDVEKKDKKALLDLCMQLIEITKKMKGHIADFLKIAKADEPTKKILKVSGDNAADISEQLRILVMIRANSMFDTPNTQGDAWKNLLNVCTNLAQSCEQVLTYGSIVSMQTRDPAWKF